MNRLSEQTAQVINKMDKESLPSSLEQYRKIVSKAEQRQAKEIPPFIDFIRKCANNLNENIFNEDWLFDFLNRLPFNDDIRNQIIQQFQEYLNLFYISCQNPNQSNLLENKFNCLNNIFNLLYFQSLSLDDMEKDKAKQLGYIPIMNDFNHARNNADLIIQKFKDKDHTFIEELQTFINICILMINSPQELSLPL
ncbi:MAG: hypothetical protein KatS3mg090_0729 [Patescibacteria group bacterium]|nr:MAG: hypothetical protein KatS3mg090_0729 [Patescibacteria group bacterium]